MFNLITHLFQSTIAMSSLQFIQCKVNTLFNNSKILRHFLRKNKRKRFLLVVILSNSHKNIFKRRVFSQIICNFAADSQKAVVKPKHLLV